MDLPLISVIMPVYNAEKYLSDAIDSILSQSIDDFEFIIINDGSTDDSEEIINQFTDNRINYVKNERNLGIIKTLNKGLSLAKGKYIARMDADDISFPERLYKQVQVFQSFPGVDMVNIKTLLIDDDGVFSRENRSAVQLNFEATRFVQYLKNMISHPGIMIKKDVIKKYLYQDEARFEYIEDFDLWLRIMRDGYICYTLETPCLYYRMSTNSINRTKGKLQHQRMFSLSKEYLKRDFDFEINDDVLLNLLGESDFNQPFLLDNTYRELIRYLGVIENNFPLSELGRKDIIFWSRYRVFSICGRFVKEGGFIGRFYSTLFLLSHLGWFFDLRFFKKTVCYQRAKKVI